METPSFANATSAAYEGGGKTEPKRAVDVDAMYRLHNSAGVKPKARHALAPVTNADINDLVSTMMGMKVGDAPVNARKAPVARKRKTNVEMATRRSTRVVSAPVPLVVESSKGTKPTRKPTAKKQVEALIRTARWNKDATARIAAAESALTVQLEIVAKAKAALAQEESKLKAITTNLEAARKDAMDVAEPQPAQMKPVDRMEPMEHVDRMDGGRKKKSRR
jgi:hypothetical protein